MNKINNDSADKKTKQKDPCYNCGQLRHWISECHKEDFVMPPFQAPVIQTSRQSTYLRRCGTQSPRQASHQRRSESRATLEWRKKLKMCSPPNLLCYSLDCVLWTYIALQTLDLLCLFYCLCSASIKCCQFTRLYCFTASYLQFHYVHCSCTTS
jgi:hypothetical protein